MKLTLKPRARKDGLVIETLPDETLVYDLDRDRAHCLNETASLVWRRCDGKRTAREIAESLTSKLNQPVNETLVWLALDQLDRNKLLQNFSPAVNKLNRREMIRALGISTAIAIPVVASIVAPAPAQAASGCATAGQACGGSNPPCCLGCSCDGICFGSC